MSVHGPISLVFSLVSELISVCPIRFSQTGDMSETEGTMAGLGGECTHPTRSTKSTRVCLQLVADLGSDA